jgi:hypothetical protein
MQFDHNHEWQWPQFLSPEAIALGRRKRDADRAAGLAVQFLHPDSGNLSEFCFSTVAQRDRFTSRLSVPFAVSARS